jgi:hypothetical protein
MSVRSDDSREVRQIDFFQKKFPGSTTVAYQNANFHAHVQQALHLGMAAPAPALRIA